MDKLKEKVKELKIVKVNGTIYLGIIKDDALIEAVECDEDGFERTDIRYWFCRYYMNELIDEIKLVGATGYTARKFNIEENRYLELCLVMMDDAKKLALKEVEKDYFFKSMKKMS